eukprot:m.134011 g.134011  ORF g.134011 m.134011 type:complete len:686 (-) comp16903_c0_seq2:1300-3357(-)
MMARSVLLHTALAAVVAMASAAPNVQATTEYYVSQASGSDTNPGTADKPFATITHARDVIRSLPEPKGAVTVTIHAGVYGNANHAEPVLALDAQDSGAPGAPIIYQAAPGANVLVSGGVQVATSLFKPYQGSILQADLSGLNISYGDLQAGSLGQCASSRVAELFVDGKPALLARYPNIDATTGLWQWSSIAKAESTSFQYSGTQPSRWVNETDAWLHGYWTFGWADSYVRIKSIDQATSTFDIDPSTPPVYGFKARARYYAVNIKAELDAPNEYYIDRKTDTLYYYPLPGFNASSTVFISTNPNGITMGSASRGLGRTTFKPTPPGKHKLAPEVIEYEARYGSSNDNTHGDDTMQDTDAPSLSYVTLRGLSVQYSRAANLVAHGVANVVLEDCRFDNAGGRGLSFYGTNSTVQGCSVSYTGCAAMGVEGGDTNALVPGNNVVQSNVAAYYARMTRTYNPGIAFGGVGNNFAKNTVRNAPHQGMTGGGNDNVFEENQFLDLCFEVTDSGAWYAGRSWTRRGSILRNNYFHNIVNTEKTVLGAPSVQAIYFDDQLSAHVVENNTFVNCHMGILIGGGRRHQVSNNNFTDIQDAAVHIDDRGLTWQKQYCTPPNGIFEQELEKVNYTQPPWSTHYPDIVNITKDHPCVPVYNSVVDNTYCRAARFTDVSTANQKAWLENYANNVEKC